MREYWWIFVGAVLCCIFSKQLDRAFEKVVKDSKKRAIWYCVTGAICLSVLGIFIYKAWSETIGSMAFLIAIGPVGLFLIALAIGVACGKAKQHKGGLEHE